MLRRLFVGLVLGAIMGGLVAAALVAGLHVAVFGGTEGVILAYLTAAVAGVLTGLVAGRPIWASGAKIEAGLKAFFGAALAAGLMFALRRWAPATDLDLSALGAGAGPIAQLPAASLPVVAAVLGGFFGLDNTPGGDDEGAAGKKRVAVEPKASRARVASAAAATADDDEGESASMAPKRAKR